MSFKFTITTLVFITVFNLFGQIDSSKTKDIGMIIHNDTASYDLLLPIYVQESNKVFYTKMNTVETKNDFFVTSVLNLLDTQISKAEMIFEYKHT